MLSRKSISALANRGGRTSKEKALMICGNRSIWTMSRAKAKLEQLTKTIEDRKDDMMQGMTVGRMGKPTATNKAYRKPA